jgi:hypothetical protein
MDIVMRRPENSLFTERAAAGAASMPTRIKALEGIRGYAVFLLRRIYPTFLAVVDAQHKTAGMRIL